MLDVTFGGYEWSNVSMTFNSYGLYGVEFQQNFNSRENALSVFDTLSSTLIRKYGPAFSSDTDSWNEKEYYFTDGIRVCSLRFIYSESRGGGMFYYVILSYADMELYKNTVDEL